MDAHPNITIRGWKMYTLKTESTGI